MHAAMGKATDGQTCLNSCMNTCVPESGHGNACSVENDNAVSYADLVQVGGAMSIKYYRGPDFVHDIKVTIVIIIDMLMLVNQK